MSNFSRLTVVVPQVNKVFRDYSKSHIKASNIEVIRSINSRYGAMCQKWGDVFEIEKGILIAFIATESMGKATVTSFTGCCFGLMQVSPDSIIEAANKFKAITKVELPQSVRAELEKTRGVFGVIEPSAATATALKARLLNDPNFNIMCGTMVLRWNLEYFSTFLTGAQLNKAIVGYNAGTYVRALSSNRKIPIDTTTLVGMKSVPSEARSYLVKMLGVDGFVSLIYKDKAI